MLLSQLLELRLLGCLPLLPFFLLSLLRVLPLDGRGEVVGSESCDVSRLRSNTTPPETRCELDRVDVKLRKPRQRRMALECSALRGAQQRLQGHVWVEPSLVPRERASAK
jgi:hypothetical protein